MHLYVFLEIWCISWYCNKIDYQQEISKKDEYLSCRLRKDIYEGKNGQMCLLGSILCIHCSNGVIYNYFYHCNEPNNCLYIRCLDIHCIS